MIIKKKVLAFILILAIVIPSLADASEIRETTQNESHFISQTGELTLDVPKGWLTMKIDDLTDCATFVKFSTPYAIIDLITIDGWAALNETTRSFYEMLGYDRSIFDEYFSDQALMADSVNAKIDDLQLWQGKHKQFYLYHETSEATYEDSVQAFDLLCAITIQNGYTYIFKLYDVSNAVDNTAAFFSLLDSVRCVDAE